jgi:hypothetical protein
MTRRRESALMWFGIFGAPVAWAIQHVVGFALTVVRCGEARSGIDFDAWATAVGAVAAVTAVAAGLAAVATFRAQRDAGDELPDARIKFLAIIGITITPLFIALILMNAFGAAILQPCHQG